MKKTTNQMLRSAKVLTLTRKTLRNLSARELEQAQGGMGSNCCTENGCGPTTCPASRSD